jgi:hypothetical protein
MKLTFGSNTDELNTLVSNELQALTSVLDLVDSHCGLLVDLIDFITSNHSQELGQFDTIGEISTDLFNAGSNLAEVGVTPS